MSPIVALIVFVVAVTGFVVFVFRWNAFYFYRLDPILRAKVGGWLGVPIHVTGRLGSRYSWITPDQRRDKQWQVFGVGLLIAILFGLLPDMLALILVGLLLRVVGVL